MFNKSLGLGLLAATLMLAPGAAFANDQTQMNEQVSDTAGSSFKGSITNQKTRLNNHQNQRIRNTGKKKYGYGHTGKKKYGYGRYYGCYPKHNSQQQGSFQAAKKDGISEFGSITNQKDNIRNSQNQNVVNRKGC